MYCGRSYLGRAHAEIRPESPVSHSLTMAVKHNNEHMGTVRVDFHILNNLSPVVSGETTDPEAWCLVEGAIVNTGPHEPGVPVQSVEPAALPVSTRPWREVEAPAQHPVTKQLPAVPQAEAAAQLPAKVSPAGPEESVNPVPGMPPVPGVPAVPEILPHAVDGGEIQNKAAELAAQRLEEIFSTLTVPSIGINVVRRGAFHAPAPASVNLKYLKALEATQEITPETMSEFSISATHCL